jgi:translocation and assembly module TamB
MNRRIRQASIGVALFFGITMVILIGVFLYLNTAHGQKFIQETASRNIPGSMTWDYGRLSFLKGEIEVKNAVIKGPDNDGIAGFDRFFIEISWPSLLRGRLTLEALLVEKPWTKLRVDKTGELNLVQAFVSVLPEEKPQEEKRATETPAGQMGIIVEKLNLSEGSLHFETADKKTTISLQKIDLAGQVDLSKQSGKLALLIREGKIENPNIRTDVDGCTLEATLVNGLVDPMTAEIQSPFARLKLSGRVTDIFDRPSINATLDCTASLHEIRQSLNLKPILTGQAVAQLQITGNLNNPDANLHLDYGGGTILENIIDGANLDLQLTDRIVTINALNIKAADGTLDGEGSMDLRQAFQKGFLSPEQDLKAVTYDISIEEKGLHLDKLRQNDQRWKGIVHSSLSLHGTGFSAESTIASGSLTIEGKQISTQQLVTPVDLHVTSDVEVNRGIATVRKLNIRADRSELDADGTFDIPSRNISGRLSLVAPDLAGTLSPFGFNNVGGTVGLKATVSGSTEHPLFALDLQGDELRFQDITLGSMSLKADLDKSGMLQISQCNVENGASNLRITGKAHMYDQITMKPFRDPAFALNIEGNTIHLEDFIKDVVTGTVWLAGHLEGTVKQPRGTVELHGKDFDLYGQKLAKINLTSIVDATKIRFDPLQVFVTPTESIESSGWVSFQKEYEMNLLSRGISLHNIEKITTQNIADGLLMIDMRGNGTFANPILNGTLSLSNVRIRGKEIEDFRLTMDLRDQVARLKGKLNFDFDGLYDLKKRDFSIAALFTETDLSPYWKIAGYPDLSGKLTGKIETNGNVRSIKKIQADMSISDLNLYYRDTEILHTRELRLSVKDEELSIPEGTLMIPPKGRIIIGGKGSFDGSASFRAEGTIPLDIAGHFVKDLSDITGALTISSKLEGTFRHPTFHADIDLEKVGVTVPVLLQKLHDLNGTIRIRPTAIIFDGISGGLDKGSFNLTGDITLRNDFRPERISLKVVATALPVQVPDTLDLLLTSQLQIEGTEEQSIIKGEIVILEGTYYKDVNLSLLQGIGQRKRIEAPPREEITYPFLKNMDLDILIKRRNPLLIDNNLATLDVNPDLRIVGTVNNPIVRGRAAVESGSVRYQGKTFIVKQGIIDFLNPYEIDPTFDIRSEVKVRDWMIFLDVSGTQAELVLKLTSDPPEEHGDILSLLLLGKTTGELISKEGGTTKSTEQMLAGLIASTYGDEIKEATGLDIFEVETSDEKSEAASDRVKVTLGKELSKRMTVKYSAESKEGELIQSAIAEYKLLEHFLARGFQDTRGIYGGELQFRLEFR